MNNRCTREDPMPSHDHWKDRVIFEVWLADGCKDYCREDTKLRGAALHAWATKQCECLDRQHADTAFTYRIERW